MYAIRSYYAFITLTAPYPGEIQHLARGQQGLEKEVAIVVAPVAIAQTGRRGHQVEGGRMLAAGKILIPHAEQTDHLEGDRSHGHHVAKGHPAGKKALPPCGFRQSLPEPVPDHRETDPAGKTA